MPLHAIYLVRGRTSFRRGNNLEFVDEAGPGDFVRHKMGTGHTAWDTQDDELAAGGRRADLDP
jgi:uncharacterized RmlC-like cupin family protein